VDFDKVIDQDNETLISLKRTKEISKEDVEAVPEWNWLSKQYAKCDSRESIYKAALSIINSFLYQRRIVFGLTRENTAEIAKNDRNWVTRVGWSNDYFPQVLRFMITHKFIEQIKYDGYGARKQAIYRVVHPDLLRFLQLDADKQLQETIDFVNYANKTRLPKSVHRIEVEFTKGRWDTLFSVIWRDSKNGFVEMWEEHAKGVAANDKFEEEIEKLIADGAADSVVDPMYAKLQDERFRLEDLQFEILAKQYYASIAYYKAMPSRPTTGRY